MQLLLSSTIFVCISVPAPQENLSDMLQCLPVMSFYDNTFTTTSNHEICVVGHDDNVGNDRQVVVQMTLDKAAKNELTGWSYKLYRPSNWIDAWFIFQVHIHITGIHGTSQMFCGSQLRLNGAYWRPLFFTVSTATLDSYKKAGLGGSWHRNQPLLTSLVCI